MDAKLARLILVLDAEIRTATEPDTIRPAYANGVAFALHALNRIMGSQMRDDPAEELHLLVNEARRELAGAVR